ncbi:MAG: hypothetical protein P0S93_00635 [Candidatus Neptunochlamydia sp.]|nr:hypothetical protein [Candidatus Neptunochlamydia sp.]
MDEEFDLPQRVFVNWKKMGLYTLPAALVAGFFVAKLGMNKGRAEGDYVSAKAAFTKWEQVLDQRGDDFTKLKKLVKKHPELQAHYDTSIAQSLLATASPQEATPFVERTLQRTQQPYYSDYARTSLKINEERYQEALDEALSLKDKMHSDLSFWKKSKNNSTLFAFNLMRIATLSEQLNHKESELEAWKEIKQYGGWDKEQSPTSSIEHEGFKQLLSHFSIQETTLLDYIEAREEELRNP